MVMWTKKPSFLIALSLGLPALVAGCAGSAARYGRTYDQSLPAIRAVAIRANAVHVHSLHSGGVLENRPEIATAVQMEILNELERCIGAKGYRVRVAPVSHFPANVSSVEDTSFYAADRLIDAVHQSILEHHYLYGKSREFDYSVGRSVGRLLDETSDAVLCVYLQAVVPTGGRQALQVTSAVVGIVTMGLPILVSGSQTQMALMLIDCTTGDVLWYDRVSVEIDVRGEHGTRKLAARITKYCLEPRKK